jgi:transcriptional regulator with XRE-family HTH domain
VIFNRFAIEEAMRFRSVTRSELAVASQLSVSYISELLNGHKPNPSAKAVRQIADALGVDPRSFWFRPQVNQKTQLREALVELDAA